jgi:ABC-type nitrate/sulfonate/bicarbonate transport system substrate-binding protein
VIGLPALVTALILAACAPTAAPGATGSAPASAPAAAAQPAAAPQPAAPAPAPPREPIKLIHSESTRDLGFLVAYLAVARGFTTEEGLDVEVVQMAANAAIPAITNKQVHFASAGSGVRAAYQGAPLRGIFYSYNQITWHAVGVPEVRSFRDLPGKVIAVSSPGSSEDWLVKLLLRREGIPLTDVNIAVLGQGPQRAQGMLAGQVHFTVLNPDLAVDMERKGFNLLGAMGDLMAIPFSGFVAHADTIREQPDALKAWLRSQVRTLQFVKRNPAETAEFVINEFGIDREAAPRAVELLLPSISSDDPGGFTEAGLRLVTEMDMAALEMSGDPLELGKRVHDVTLLRQAQRDLGIRCTTGYQCQ